MECCVKISFLQQGADMETHQERLQRTKGLLAKKADIEAASKKRRKDPAAQTKNRRPLMPFEKRNKLIPDTL